MTDITLSEAISTGVIYKSGAFWYIKGRTYTHFVSSSDAYGYAAAHGLLPQQSGAPATGIATERLGTHTAGKTEGATSIITISSPLSVWVGLSPAAYYGWPILDWPLWSDLLVFAAIEAVVLYAIIR